MNNVEMAVANWAQETRDLSDNTIEKILYEISCEIRRTYGYDEAKDVMTVDYLLLMIERYLKVAIDLRKISLAANQYDPNS